MHGSLNLGKEVMDTLTYYLRNGLDLNQLSGRRSMNEETDPIVIEIKSAALCKNLEFCKGNLEKFVHEYVLSMAHSVEGNIDSVFNQKAESSSDIVTFFEPLKGILSDIKKLLKTADEKVNEDNEAYVWTGVIKKIGAKFQRKAISYIVDKLDADVSEAKKILTQILVVEIALIEAKAQKKLCGDFKICSKSVACSTALNLLLGRLKNLPNDKIKTFMKHFQEALAQSGFYNHLDHSTSREFQIILNDMSRTDDVPSKDIFASIQETVELRIKTMYSSTELKKGQDIQLVHMILSDMDYLYSKQKAEPFHSYMDEFQKWSKYGGKILDPLVDTIRNIEDTLVIANDEFVIKLINEVRVFLEITVDQ